ncbi:hypothetical protein NC652_023770 [Populus alba x Populus x berolinensis]|nr:hypothetical protein NC652_023770 [Populus alba x Populus x berolinensis]
MVVLTKFHVLRREVEEDLQLAVRRNTSRASSNKTPTPTTTPAIVGTRLVPSPLPEDDLGLLFDDESLDGPSGRGGGGDREPPLSFFWGGGVVTYFHQKRKAVVVKNLSLQMVAVGVRLHQKVVAVLLLVVVERPLLGVGVGMEAGTLLEAAMTPMVVVGKPEILQERGKT